MRDHLEWMRRHHPTTCFHGLDLGGSNASLLPGLDAVLVYLAQADPEFQADLSIRETAAATAATSAPAALAAYGALPSEARDALTAGLADLTAHMTGRRLDYLRRTTAEDHRRGARVTARRGRPRHGRPRDEPWRHAERDDQPRRRDRRDGRMDPAP